VINTHNPSWTYRQ